MCVCKLHAGNQGATEITVHMVSSCFSFTAEPLPPTGQYCCFRVTMPEAMNTHTHKTHADSEARVSMPLIIRLKKDSFLD